MTSKARLGSANVTSSRFTAAKSNYLNKTSRILNNKSPADSPIKKEIPDLYLSPARQPIRGGSSFSNTATRFYNRD
jgi:hypothetical protein